jgi:hypothetical protein
VRATSARAQRRIQRRQPDGAIGQHLNGHPALTDSTTGPNTGSMLAPPMSSRAWARRTMDCTVYPCSTAVWSTALHKRCHGSGGGANGRLVLQVERDAADVGLVADLRRQHLSATGKPISRAARAAASASAGTVRVVATAMP